MNPLRQAIKKANDILPMSDLEKGAFMDGWRACEEHFAQAGRKPPDEQVQEDQAEWQEDDDGN